MYNGKWGHSEDCPPHTDSVSTFQAGPPYQPLPEAAMGAGLGQQTHLENKIEMMDHAY